MYSDVPPINCTYNTYISQCCRVIYVCVIFLTCHLTFSAISQVFDWSDDLFVVPLAGLSNGDVRLTDSSELYSGRVEVYHNSRWFHAHVSGNEWTTQGAKVACRAMGFERVVNSSFPTAISTPTNCFTSLPCEGDEYNFQTCFNPLPPPCPGDPDVGIQCAGILSSIQQPPVTMAPTATPSPPVTTSECIFRNASCPTRSDKYYNM